MARLGETNSNTDIEAGTPAAFHGSTDSPVGSWDLNGDLTAVVGNALSVEAGTELYVPAAVLGQEAIWFDGSLRVVRAAHDAALALLGALSVGCIVNMARIETALKSLLVFGTAGETEATNTLYRLQVETGNRLAFYQESGAGVDNTLQFGAALPVGQFVHVMVTRDSAGTGVNLYLDGVNRGSGTMANAATGGGSSVFAVGCFPTVSTQNIAGIVSTPVVYNTELSASAVEALANLTLPPELRSP